MLIHIWYCHICSFEKGGGHASGFVGTLTIDNNTVTVLVTNNHVFEDRASARSATYEFGYQQVKSDNPSFDQSLQPDVIKGIDLISKEAKFYTRKVSFSVSVAKLYHFQIHICQGY